MKKIRLTQGKFALVDDDDFDWLNQWKWQFTKNGYAGTDFGGRKNKKKILMHRLINETPDSFVTDHVNRNKLDNRRNNLRTVTQRQNTLNSNLSKNNTSGHNGVDWYKNRWVARIKFNYKNIYLGRFEKLEDAIAARKLGEQKYAV